MSRCRDYMVGIGLLVLAACVPARQSAKGVGDQELPAGKVEAQAPETVRPKSTPPALPSQAKAPEPQSSEPKPPEPKGYRLPSDDPLVAERISLFEQKKNDWDATGERLAALDAQGALPAAWQECRQDIEQALAGYRRLQAGEDRSLNPWEVMGRDMHFFSRNCDQVLATAQKQGDGAQAPSTATVQGSDSEPIRQNFETGQYQEVVTAYEGFAKGLEGAGPSRADKFFYARALVKLGRFQEAIGVLTELLRGEAGQPTDLTTFEIRMLTADVLLATGQVNEAKEVYDGLAKVLVPVASQQKWAEAQAQVLGEELKGDDLILYREVIQAYLLFDGQRVPQALVDGVAALQSQPASPLQELAGMLQSRATEQSQTWVRGQLAEARALINTHDLARAKVLVDQLAKVAPAEMQAAVTQIQEEVARAEQAAPAGAGATAETSQVSPWDEAMHLFEQQKYDEAIAGFQQLLGDSEHGSEAKTKMAEAADLAAAAMRRQAAVLYAKARKTFDPEAKRQALLESRSLLVRLIARYPEANAVAKARQNLKVLEAELGQTEAISPQFPSPAGGGEPHQF